MASEPLGAQILGFGSVAASYLGAGLVVALAVVASRSLARRSGIPYPVFLVVAGAVASFIPHVEHLALDPRVVFLGILPLLVYHAGLVTSPRELRAHAWPIGLGAFGLVLVTTFAVAGVARAVAPGLGWVGAFVLGAVVAPTDPVASTSVFGRLGVAPRVTTILEGESLVNDGVALALFSIGVAAVARPTTVAGGLLAFVKVAGGGTAFGLVVGWLAARIRRPIGDAPSQVVVSLLVPFLAYLPADALGLSGVLATLATGLVLGQRPSALGPSGRIRLAEFWQVLVFLLESVLFVLVGLQLRRLLAGVGAYRTAEVAELTALAVVTVVGVRLVWWLAIPTVRWRPEGRLVDTGGVPLEERIALGWSGLRGAISLAAALSVPSVVSGHRFPGRVLVVFTTFCVIIATLIGQGVSLPVVLKRLGLGGSEVQQRQRALAERRCAEAALRLIDEVTADEQLDDAVTELLRQRYERRLERAQLLADNAQEHEGRRGAPRADLELRLLDAQRDALGNLHRSGDISYSVMRAIRRQLDLEQTRLAP